jgi:hypothetical protein
MTNLLFNDVALTSRATNNLTQQQRLPAGVGTQTI